ncbi:MAG: KEOPS complex subunit Cgi121 [Thaumarchaeota archaeon]|nr:KEOPS complex subunit Cgi121 [Candidatus Calditenuaceae archaeon]MDW8041804.1 KEOPS complex subunit Cgi121 [Nitrososphaerota archaeon]
MISESYGGYRVMACGVRAGVEDPVGALADLRPEGDVWVQLYNPDAVASERHIVLAFMCAIDSFLSGTNRAKRVEVEVLRYLACSTQIEEALRRAGVREGSKEVGVLIVSRAEVNPSEALSSVVEGLKGKLAPELTFRGRAEDLLARYGVDPTKVARFPRSEGVEMYELLLLEEMVALRV